MDKEEPCILCDKRFDSNDNHHFCEFHRKLPREGYVALVLVEPIKGADLIDTETHCKVEAKDLNFLGPHIFVHKKYLSKLMDMEEEDRETEVLFLTQESYDCVLDFVGSTQRGTMH